jgi:hypothetical protein
VGDRGRRRSASGDDGIALVLTVFLMLLVASMSMVIGTAVLIQVKPTQFEAKATQTVFAAEAGLDIALNRIRGAQDNKGEGTRRELPCTATAGTVVSGPVAPAVGGTEYNVRIRYYTSDPSAATESWRADPANLVACASDGPVTVPAYALVESTGTGAALPGTANTATRVLEQTYRFQTTNANIPGGRIFNNLTPLCLAAESHRHNANVLVKTCDETGTDVLQRWAYTPELLLMTTDADGKEYCIEDARHGGRTEATLTQNCDSLEADQLWSFNNNGRFEGAEAKGGGGSDKDEPAGPTNGWCLTVERDTLDGSKVVVKAECSGYYDSQHTFNPEAAVGAGKASDASQQLVNFKDFGRCLDITRQRTDATFLIAYPCKQAPSSAYVEWNQKLYWDATAEQFCTDITNATVTSCSRVSTNLYCLQAGTVSAPPVHGTRVLVARCSGSDVSQKWTRRYKTQSSASAYNILTQVGGLCLDLNPSGAGEADDYDKQWGVVQVSRCNGSNRQKWNAPPNLAEPATINVYEHDRS